MTFLLCGFFTLQPTHMASAITFTGTHIEASPVNPTMARGDVATDSGFPDLYEVLKTSI